jgi:hypothetical protein
VTILCIGVHGLLLLPLLLPIIPPPTSKLRLRVEISWAMLCRFNREEEPDKGEELKLTQETEIGQIIDIKTRFQILLVNYKGSITFAFCVCILNVRFTAKCVFNVKCVLNIIFSFENSKITLKTH